MSLLTTASQTVGPYVTDRLCALRQWSISRRAGVSGERITLAGRVIDGDGKPVDDAVVEIWQANAHGKYAHPEDAQDKPIEAGFRGFGRCRPTRRAVSASRPSSPGASRVRRALRRHRISSSPYSCAACSSTSSRAFTFPTIRPTPPIPCSTWCLRQRRATLIARRAAGDKGALEWNVILQGPDETVFFDF